MDISILNKLDFSHFEEMMQLENQFYDDEYITPAMEAYLWYKEYPHTTIAAAENNKIIGFVNLFPVKKDIFEGIKAGTFNDQALSTNDIESLNSEELYMFLSCIVVKNKYRKYGITKKLLQKAIIQYNEVEKHCKWIVIDTVTEDGARFSEKYGFSFVRESNHNSKIYIQTYYDFIQHVFGGDWNG